MHLCNSSNPDTQRHSIPACDNRYIPHVTSHLNFWGTCAWIATYVVGPFKNRSSLLTSDSYCINTLLSLHILEGLLFIQFTLVTSFSSYYSDTFYGNVSSIN